jgi:hypothetical protein
MHTIHPSRFLKVALLADALVSGLVAALQLLAGKLLTGLLALPAMLLLESGVFLVAYVTLLLVMARSQRLWSWLVLMVIVGNVGWALGCLGLLQLLPAAPSALGIAFLLLQAAAVLVFAGLEWAGWRTSSPAGPVLRTVQS